MQTRRGLGFTLIEVLVAVLVLALGVIGGAAMQLTALRTRHQSALLSNAVQLASAMADKMRANVEQMDLDDGENPYLNLNYDVATEAQPAAPGFSCFSPAARCTSAQMASIDIYELKQQMRAGLPGGRLVICRDANAWDEGRKSLNWTCSGAPMAPIMIKLGWRGKNPDGSPALDGAHESPPAVALTLRGAAR